MEDLRPFALTGPFISMIYYVLKDIRPFMVLGTLMIITFGMAFRVLFADLAEDESGESFRTLPLSFESMFHATLGQFETEVVQIVGCSFIATLLHVGPACIIYFLVHRLEISSLQSVPVPGRDCSAESLDRRPWRHVRQSHTD